jgi:proteasome lid subunit RPN8/RPN11
MKLLLPTKVIKVLRREIRGRRQEIGGVLVGENLGPDTFRIVNISVQRSGGTSVHFVRDPEHSKAFLSDFFARTKNDYERFNYIGEWHSHPAFEPLPSGPDFQTMYNIVEDPDVGVNFAILIIARLQFRRSLQLSATLFRAGIVPEPIEVIIDEEGEPERAKTLLSRIREMFWW